MKTIEIRKAGFTNKGAEMMLVASVQQLRLRLPSARLVVAPNYTLPFERRAKLGLWHRAEMIKKGYDLGRAVEALPGKLRERYGFVTSAEVDVILDAAGFAYSDQWGSAPIFELDKRAARWKEAGKKIILLPQAFGPFEKPGAADAIRRIADRATLIYARDRQSYHYLVHAVGERESIRISPDFTTLLRPTYCSTIAKGEGAVAVVPNARMLDMTGLAVKDIYESFLLEAIDRLQAAGLTPFFLIHETLDDLALARRINAARGEPLEIREVEDAVAAKGLIAQCDGLIGSRYHALVSALDQAVPAIGTGWSHKYQELFNDYDYGEGLVDIPLSTVDFDAKLAPLLSSEGRAEISRRLSTASRKIEAKVSAMWDEIEAVIAA
ncbi:polysaccharide pyruvyl transferase family protein [Salipiger marinus]|uniref:polysaccharide pyruvyl transferase family protein n=1 Tax=Salipiger marinus TaxID=555512 RepID=UPI002B974FD1|nr:polysaccharide pyruvyl transferase family protein [Salipiger manganoxidans]MEB3421675.1 polysaccharide pyruvyl transferase family protein [Salipiger manganoxidans]